MTWVRTFQRSCVNEHIKTDVPSQHRCFTVVVRCVGPQLVVKQRCWHFVIEALRWSCLDVVSHRERLSSALGHGRMNEPKRSASLPCPLTLSPTLFTMGAGLRLSSSSKPYSFIPERPLTCKYHIQLDRKEQWISLTTCIQRKLRHRCLPTQLK